MKFEKLKELLIYTLVLILSLLFLWLMRRFTIEDPIVHVSFTIGFLLVLGFAGGKIASIFSLPQLSGFLAIGVLSGSSGLSLIGTQEVLSLTLFNELALALIAIQAGSEISLSFLKKGTKSLLWVIIFQSLILIIGMCGVLLLLVYKGGFSVDDSTAGAVVFAIMFAVLSISKAPADTLAILGETGLKGSFANHILGVVVLIDVLVIVLFQITLLLVKPYIIPGAFFDSSKVASLFGELLSSLAAGFSVGLIFILWFLTVRNTRQNILFVILSAFGIGSMCHYLRYDELIVFIVGGFIVSNLSQKGHSLVETVDKISHGVMIVFFATAGAMLDLNALKTLWPYALILAFSRIIFTALGSLLGHMMAKDDLSRYGYSFSGYISQAGVTLVLAQTASMHLGEIGIKLASLATAVVAINEIVGPICFKLAIKRELALEKNLS